MTVGIRFFHTAVLATILSSAAAVGKGVDSPAAAGGIPASGAAEIAPGMLILKMKTVLSLAPGATGTGFAAVDGILARVRAREITPILPMSSALGTEMARGIPGPFFYLS